MSSSASSPLVPVANDAPTGADSAKKKAVTAKSKKRKGKGQSKANTNATLQRRGRVDKAIMDELLLVCGVIGTVDPNTNEFVPVHECLNWLQDLQRAVRRDDDLQRPISLLLGQWKIMQQKLLPLCLYSGRYDRPLLITLCKILVMLTKPLHETTERAGRVVINPKQGKNSTTASGKDIHDRVVQEQIWLRENAIQQADLLLDYKKAFCQVHLQSRNGHGLFSILVSMLAEPLGKSGRRSDEDHMAIELVLHLFCNLLRAKPLFASGAARQYRMDHEQVHDELVHLMHQELVLDILCVLASDLEHRDNAPYNLIVMETLHHLWKPYSPVAVAEAFSNKKDATGTRPGKQSNTLRKTSLLGKMQRERQSYAVKAHSRHGHFGGTLQIQKKNRIGAAEHQYVSSAQFAATALASNQNPNNQGHNSSNNIQVGGKNKQTSVFVPSGAEHVRHGPSAQRAHRILYQFLERFCQECYGPMAKSLKGEFRRDSVKLQEGDQVLFLRFIKFVSQWWRLAKQSQHLKKNVAAMRGKEDKKAVDSGMATCIGPFIFTMDVFTFDLVIKSIESFQQHKRYPRLAVAVSVLNEMMHLLHSLFQSNEQTEHVMALGLLDRLFYSSEPMDKLPQLLSKWEPGTTTREYLADLVEVCHMQLKLLETNEASCRSADKKDQDAAVAKKQESARHFDVQSYVRKRLLSVHSIFMYSQLLGQFEHNSKTTNHRIVAFLKNRVSKTVIFQPDSDEELSSLPNPTVTLQPILFQFSILRILDRILNAAPTLSEEQQKILVPWATSVIYDFSQAAKRNPMLWVETLMAPNHSIARHCDQITNVYVSEELRMIMVKEQLQQQLYLSRNGSDSEREDDDDEEEEELEFEDAPKEGQQQPLSKRKADTDETMGGPTAKRPKSSADDESEVLTTTKRKIIADSDSESDEELIARIRARNAASEKRNGVTLDDSDSDESEAADEPPNGNTNVRSNENSANNKAGRRITVSPKSVNKHTDLRLPRESASLDDEEEEGHLSKPPPSESLPSDKEPDEGRLTTQKNNPPPSDSVLSDDEEGRWKTQKSSAVPTDSLDSHRWKTQKSNFANESFASDDDEDRLETQRPVV